MLFSAKNFFPAMKGKEIDVIGLGVSNTELVFRLAKEGAYVTLHDRREEPQLRPALVQQLKEAGVSLSLGGGYLDDLDGEIIFRTPGMSYLTPALQQARARGQAVTSELEMFLELCPCRTWGITGSDGKTTTTSLIAEMLRSSGRTVHIGGNIGKPLLPILDKIGENDCCVVELSSFQLLSMRCSPDVAVLTNISPNHLDVHKDMAEYIDAKRNVLAHQNGFSRAVISADSETAAQLAGGVRGQLRQFSRRKPLENGAWLSEQGELMHSINGKAVRIISQSEVRLPGLHNIENLLAASAAVWGFVSPKDIAEVARTFAGVEHRIEFVREHGGVRWYNDSIATSPTRTIAGLMSFDEKLIVIAGGYDKKIPFEPLAGPLVSRCKTLILTGPTADKIEAAVTAHPDFVGSKMTILRAPSLEEAVKTAADAARPGDIVTLSPACASFDAFANFEERGRFFKELVRAL